jgi:hypothetical protein
MYGWNLNGNNEPYMKTSIFASWLLLTATLPLSATSEHIYPSNQHIALRLSTDLYDTLTPQFQKQLYPQPVCMGPLDSPVITPIGSNTEDTTLRQVFISAGCIDLLNHVAHAKAIDRIKPGFFRQYVQTLADTADSPSIANPRYWTDDVIDDQMSYFNQMIGFMVAINLSHHYLGHFAKYSCKMPGPGGKLTPINDFLTPAEWDASVKAAALDSLDCALATDGPRALFDAIDKMPTRPAWASYILPKHVDIKKLNKQIAGYEHDFFRGQLK